MTVMWSLSEDLKHESDACALATACALAMVSWTYVRFSDWIEAESR